MKEKIERLSIGNFEYELPFIYLSEEEIKITAQAGKKVEGSFTISNSHDRYMKGIIYSSNRHMKVKDNSFQGTQCKIEYEFNAACVKDGETIDGNLCIVSDCGERILPFTVQTNYACYTASLGMIKDLFQFTNLARMDWSEAKKLFRSEDFEQMLLSNEERYRFIYRNLIKGISTSQALEEYLIAIHKKFAIRLEVDRTQLEYEITQEIITDKLILTKNNWGYAEIRVSTDAPFLALEQKYLWADRFTSNTHQITFRIDPNCMRDGNNYGHIYIKTTHQLITVEVLCKKKKEENQLSEYRSKQKIEFALVDNYLNFRLNRSNLEEYVDEAQELLKQFPGPETGSWKELMMIHLSMVSGKTKIAQELLSDFASQEKILKKKDLFEYCSYLYLNSVYYKDDITIKQTADIIRGIYEDETRDWRILWFLLNIDKRYEKNKLLKLTDIKRQFEAGCRSPILYYEAICLLNEEPYLLRELGEFEIQTLNFGIRNWILSKEVAGQFTYQAAKMKNFHPVVFHGLERLYDEFSTPEMLTAICCMLIKGMKRSEKYFEWYRLGVEAQLRITELYEYYMYSISDNYKGTLAQPVLLYFIYNSNLSDKKKAFLYANIVMNKDKNEPIYRSYYKRMEIFTSKMLEGHFISRDLAVLYKEFLCRNSLSPELSRHLPYVIYRSELICSNSNITNVIVIHREMKEEKIYTLVEGKAQIDIFTNNAEVFFIDHHGNRFVENIEYTITPFLNPDEYESLCTDSENHPMLLLHCFDRCQSYRIMNPASIELRRKVITLEGLTKEYYSSCCQALIEYYYENYNDERLEYYLNMLDLHQVRPNDRSKYIESMVVRAFYEKSMEALETFGMDGIGVNRLVKFCSGWMLKPEAEDKHDFMLSLCYYAFSHNKYNEAILNYLIKYYNGPTREMSRLWKAAKEFELDTHSLEERLITQILFTESYSEGSFLVFSSYYNEVNNHTLVRAFLTYFAYRYLLHDAVIHPQIFSVIKRELGYEENDVCLLAWLKYQANNKQLTENEIIFAEFNLMRLIRQGLVLPFFLEYKKWMLLPDQVLDRYFITYQCDPRNHVYIHYRLLNQESQDFITERMPNMFMGIHLKMFQLFYHESFQYYITEDSPEGSNITESYHTLYECADPEEDDSKYNQINLMLMAKEMQDDNTLLTLMEHYMKTEYMIHACFKPIE